ncbi:unnamed protein product [Adineta steineri]|uniref:D-glucuronyl C5-epimerase C-terminal domain-containing protein n=1 Tax=Adineta steineri TaxID=433720 RepID=A0A814UZN6_9BILA|nr:unnamed protein product [Adineta steineri]CAF1181398.1 unnamed protein product [Adineta steineri]
MNISSTLSNLYFNEYYYESSTFSAYTTDQLYYNYQYNSRESYLNFAYFNVEQRNRVLYIDFLYDIPVSSQWRPHGHLYPIQIAHVDQLIIGNQTLYDQQAFYSATRWLLNNQDLQTGCWFIHVQRNYAHHTHYHLRNSWCSAMAQAASLLVRLYSLTNNKEHLLAIRRAIQPL